MATMHLPSNSYVVAFLNNDAESQLARTLLDKVAVEIQQIRVRSEEEDVPRLVTEERVFSGYKQIEEYCKIWLPSRASIPK